MVVTVVLMLGAGAGGAVAASGGVGVGAAGVSMCPASTEPASVRLRIVAAHICRKGFTLEASQESCKIFATPN